jgi:hypothetical protein
MVIAAHQELTRQWWKDRSGEFELVTSELVQEEARRGNPEASADRLAALGEIPIVSTSDAAVALTEHLVTDGPIPQESAVDALCHTISGYCKHHVLVEIRP